MIKGGMLREFVSWYEEKHGVERMRWLAARLPEEARRFIDPDERLVNVLAASWYPARFTHAILDVVSEGLAEKEIERMCRDSTRWIVQRGMTSVYRFALRRLITPEMYAASVPRLWRQLHTTGDREIKLTSKTSAESFVRSWPGHHAVLCTITVETMCAIFESMGKKNLRWKRSACVSRGGRECMTSLAWT